MALSGVAGASPLARLLPWTHWRHLPRDARDTLFLLCVIGWTVLPHVSHLPAWCGLLTLAVLLWRARLALTNAPLPNRWWIVAVLAVAAGLTLWSHGTLLGRDAGITLTVVLMALKTLELRARRDAFVVFFLGFFLILTQFLYSQALPVALAMLVSVWGLMTGLVLANMPVGRPSLRRAGALAARTALIGAPIMVLLFVLFPRVGPLWKVPNDRSAVTGLSDSMRMGSVAELAADDSIALRVRFDGPLPPSQALYFRGPVLTRFDGAEWQALPPLFGAPGAAPPALRATGPALRYEMTLEPSRRTTVPLLEAATAAPRIEGYRVVGEADLQWHTDRALVERVRFDAVAYVDFRLGPTARDPSLALALELPDGYNPRTVAWAAELRRDPRFANADARSLARAVLQHVRDAGYSYTLTPGTYGDERGLDAIDEFWLDRRAGFCEHFAAAFVVVMRAAGVPARVVTGYQGTDALPVDGYYAVRQSSAHAWAEYWQAGSGWERADPTAAVAPERVARGTRLLPARGLVEDALGTVNPQLLAQLQRGWEGLNNRWNQWVLSYSRGAQFELLKDLGFNAPSWDDLALLLIGTLSTLALGGAAWAWWDRRRIDPWTRQRLAMQRALAPLGIEMRPFDAPRALAQRVRERLGAPGEPLARLLDTLERQRYAEAARTAPDRALGHAFAAAARRLRRGPSRRAVAPTTP